MNHVLVGLFIRINKIMATLPISHTMMTTIEIPSIFLPYITVSPDATGSNYTTENGLNVCSNEYVLLSGMAYAIF